MGMRNGSISFLYSWGNLHSVVTLSRFGQPDKLSSYQYLPDRNIHVERKKDSFFLFRMRDWHTSSNLYRWVPAMVRIQSGDMSLAHTMWRGAFGAIYN